MYHSCCLFGVFTCFGICLPSNFSFDPAVNLAPSVFTFSPCGKVLFLHIKASKTDPFRQGITIRLANIGGKLCPVNAIRQYLLFLGGTHGPLFILSSGDFVTRKYVSAFLSISLKNNLDLNTHSFQIGGASAAASCGFSESVIKILGRWSSDCYRGYVHVSNNALLEWSSKHCKHKQVVGLKNLGKFGDAGLPSSAFVLCFKKERNETMKSCKKERSRKIQKLQKREIKEATKVEH
ncbi:uncharacterized protein LOC130653678 [Hydractinia symbiolongicarpus]|uniref:uncharacterized protein LOC130653678 n=1 Tax=Hydractinia symbiolongicarpus TaxID=13093 RepID=UPI00254D6319|nr:uncharacterized protein LOC130653678 [Hydractinia symbiolongicarpus]